MEQSIPTWLSTFEEEIDSYIFISSRDSKLYLGILRSYDHHGNIFLTHCVEKIIVAGKCIFSDVYVGNLILRGDNIAYFGAVDEEKYAQLFDYTETENDESEIDLPQEKEKSVEQKTESGSMVEEGSTEKPREGNIVLRYIPVNRILKFTTHNTTDSACFEN